MDKSKLKFFQIECKIFFLFLNKIFVIFCGEKNFSLLLLRGISFFIPREYIHSNFPNSKYFRIYKSNHINSFTPFYFLGLFESIVQPINNKIKESQDQLESVLQEAD